MNSDQLEAQAADKLKGVKENKCVAFFAEKDDHGDRQRWVSNTTFVLAAIGSAIGLGNFWRFPYLCYKWGGALFFVPYLICLFFLGIPMLLLEFSLGQKFQRGDIGVFRGIHPRLAGVGVASVFCSYSITFYYNVIISWSLVYFFAAFMNPLPWSVQYVQDTKTMVRECEGMSISEEFFYRDILHIIDDNCEKYDTQTQMGGESVFQWQVFCCVIITWIIVYFCVFKGVKSSSYVVWVTVPLPTVFVFLMVLNGLCLENADAGIRMYLRGITMKFSEDVYDAATNTTTTVALTHLDSYGNTVPGEIVMPDVAAKLSDSAMWAEACAQIFFSIGVCMGIMTSYASYNNVDQPIIENALRVSFGNSLFSFFAGFAVFSTVGYLQGQQSVVADKVSSIGLAFIAYPAAIETLPGPNFWTLLLAITLFTLGLDSAFSMVEATSTVVQDTAIGRVLPRKLIALILCVTGCCCSFIFCFNWGFTYFDTVDHYLAVYLLLLLGIMQAFGAAWIYQAKETIESVNKVTVYILAFGYWVPLIPLGLLAYFAFPNDSWVAMPVFWGIQIIVWIASFATSKVSFGQWYNQVFLYGVGKLARSMAMLSTKEGKKEWWCAGFEFYWGFCIKYFFPWAVWWLLSLSFANDVAAPYGGNYVGWQVLGFLFPIVGILSFIVPIFLCKTADPFSKDIEKNFSEYTDSKPAKSRKVEAAPAAEAPAKTEDPVN